MEIFKQKHLDEFQKYVGIKKQYTILCGKIKTRFRSRILYNGILKTQYFKTYEEAKTHYKIELIKNGKIIKSNKLKIA